MGGRLHCPLPLMSATTQKEDGGDLIEAMQQFKPSLNPNNLAKQNKRKSRPKTKKPKQIPPLSAEARKALRRDAGYRPTILCRVCSKCGQMPSMVEGPHPLDEKISRIRKYLASPSNRRNGAYSQAEDDRHRLESIRHHTSRCCGERYEKREVDQHQALWEAWICRQERCRHSITSLRAEHEERTSRARSDDFLILSRNLGLGDNTIEALERIFRSEEETQQGQAAIASSRALDAKLR
jgi:hypothetical protein